MLDLQNDGCAICGDKPKEGMSLPVDHCHSTNKIRGILCDSCNRGLGHFYDDEKLLNKALEYIIKSKE